MSRIIKREPEREPSFYYKQYTTAQLKAGPEPDPSTVLLYRLKTGSSIASDAFEVFKNDSGPNEPLNISEDNLVNFMYAHHASRIFMLTLTAHSKGTWNGYVYTSDQYPLLPMETYRFNPNSATEPAFSWYSSGHKLNNGPFSLSGTCSRDKTGTLQVKFKVEYDDGSARLLYDGRVDKFGSLVGFRTTKEVQPTSTPNVKVKFIFRRAAPEIMRHRPSPDAIKEDKYPVFWRFAIDAVLDSVRRERWSWCYFSTRRERRRRFIRLSINQSVYGRPLTQEEERELRVITKLLTPSESILYRSIRDYVVETIPLHR